MTKLYLEEEQIDPYWTQTTTYGNDFEIVYTITE